MRKEVIIAIIFGGLLGVIIAFGAARLNTSFKKEQKKVQKEPNKAGVYEGENTNINPVSGGLTIVYPADKSVHQSSIITLSGLTIPKSTIIITGGSSETLSNAGGNGEFETTVELDPGLNQLVVHSFNGSRDSKVNLLTIFTTKVDGEPETEPESENAVTERLEKAARPITASLGTVTDITEAGVQIKTESGEISQINLTDKTTYANIVKESKEVQFSDLAIGDFIAALGRTTNGNELLEAQRVLITLPPTTESSITVVKGTVKVLSSREFVIIDLDGREWSIDAKGGVAITGTNESGEIAKIKLATIKEGDTIIVIGELVKEELEASRIHKI